MLSSQLTYHWEESQISDIFKCYHFCSQERIIKRSLGKYLCLHSSWILFNFSLRGHHQKSKTAHSLEEQTNFCECPLLFTQNIKRYFTGHLFLPPKYRYGIDMCSECNVKVKIPMCTVLAKVGNLSSKDVNVRFNQKKKIVIFYNCKSVMRLVGQGWVSVCRES